MRQQFGSFVVRWLLNTLGLWLAVQLFGTGHDDVPGGLGVFLIAGLIFSIVNVVLKPIAIVLSLPALLLTLGLFMLIVNGALVYVAIALTPGIEMTFWFAVLTGVVISLVNYIVSNVIDLPYGRSSEEKR